MKQALLILASLLTLISCKKKDTTIIPGITIVGKWKMTGYLHNGMDVYGTQVSTCVTDDIITFTNNNQVTVDEGLTKCNSSDPQSITGTYLLNGDKTELTVTNDGVSDINYVRELNPTTLKLEQASNGDTITYTRLP